MRIDVWTYAITGAERCEELVPVLSAEEVGRYERYHFERNRREFLCAHALLRRALSREAGGAPEAWTFGTGEWGKPFLVGAEELEFNLSHTNGFVSCAIARGVEVGVDVERVDRSVEAVDIARRFFADEEWKYIEGLPEGLQRDAFFRIWTLKEAYVKACGRGFDLPLRDFWFELRGGSASDAGGWVEVLGVCADSWISDGVGGDGGCGRRGSADVGRWGTAMKVVILAAEKGRGWGT